MQKHMNIPKMKRNKESSVPRQGEEEEEEEWEERRRGGKGGGKGGWALPKRGGLCQCKRAATVEKGRRGREEGRKGEEEWHELGYQSYPAT